MRAIVLSALLLAFAACTPIRDNQGYLGDDELMSSIKVGTDNKSSVAKTLGRPSIASQWDDREWYYLSRVTRTYAFRSPRPETQKLMVVHFDPKGNVTKIERRGLEQIASISPERDSTKTLGKQRSFWQAIFGNIGQVGGIGQGQGGANQDNTGGR